MLDISEVEVDEEGLQWIATHIHTFMAVGAPFLGAPKIVRGVVLLLLSRPCQVLNKYFVLVGYRREDGVGCPVVG